MVRINLPGDGPPVPHHPATDGERGSQAVEFALVIPAVLLLILLIVQTGIMAADLVTATGIAREAARTAAVDNDTNARAAAMRAAGSRHIHISFVPPSGARAPGDLVTATLRLRSHSFAVFGTPVWLPAQATMRVEDSPP
jgi:hypothetical protein